MQLFGLLPLKLVSLRVTEPLMSSLKMPPLLATLFRTLLAWIVCPLKQSVVFFFFLYFFLASPGVTRTSGAPSRPPSAGSSARRVGASPRTRVRASKRFRFNGPSCKRLAINLSCLCGVSPFGRFAVHNRQRPRIWAPGICRALVRSGMRRCLVSAAHLRTATRREPAAVMRHVWYWDRWLPDRAWMACRSRDSIAAPLRKGTVWLTSY